MHARINAVSPAAFTRKGLAPTLIRARSSCMRARVAAQWRAVWLWPSIGASSSCGIMLRSIFSVASSGPLGSTKSPISMLRFASASGDTS